MQFVQQSYMTFKCDVLGLFQMTLIIQIQIHPYSSAVISELFMLSPFQYLALFCNLTLLCMYTFYILHPGNSVVPSTSKQSLQGVRFLPRCLGFIHHGPPLHIAPQTQHIVILELSFKEDWK